MKSDVHNMYMEEVRYGNADLHPVSSKYFNFVWRVRVPHLKVRVFHRFDSCTVIKKCPFLWFMCCLHAHRVHRFAVCEKCTEIDDHLQKATSDSERRLWLQAKKRHREYVSDTCMMCVLLA